VQNVVNLKPEIVGEQHVRTLLIDRLSNARLSAIAFRAVGTKLGEALLTTRGQALYAVGQLKVQEWNGKTSVQLQIEDIAAC
jgi:single-stranded-DNA-specific exonuclease